MLTKHSAWVYAVALTEDDLHAVSGSGDGTLKVWDLRSGALIRTLTGHEDRVTAVVTTRDDKVLSASADHTIKMWNLRTGKVIHSLEGHTGEVHTLAVFSGGQRVVSAAEDRTLKVWDLRRFEALANFTADAPIPACAASCIDNAVTIVAGDAGGKLHLLHLEKSEVNPAL